MTKAHITIAQVISAMAAEEGLSAAQLRGPKRHRCFSEPRMLVYLLARKLCPHASYAKIGDLLNRHHTTVILGERRMLAKLKRRPDLRRTYNVVLARLTR